MPAGILPENEEPYSTSVNDSAHAADMKGVQPRHQGVLSVAGRRSVSLLRPRPDSAPILWRGVGECAHPSLRPALLAQLSEGPPGLTIVMVDNEVEGS